MKIALRYFAGVRETVGISSEQVVLPEHVQTVGDVRAWLIARGSAWAEALGEEKTIRMALNQQMTEAVTPIEDGAEVAFFPPVTGG